MINEKEWEEELLNEDSDDPLKPKERLLFNLIKERDGIITIREIQDILGFSSTSVVSRYMDKLVRKNFVQKVKGYRILKDQND